ncbi:MAG: N-acetyltransferase [Coleofasciculaceae cyanobacterium]
MVSFAQEKNDDIISIREVVTAAFGRTSEAKLVEAIRNSRNFIPELSIVATEKGNLLGHILLSPIPIEAQGQTFSALALAPLAVIPTRQREGIGTELVKVALSKCRELDHNLVVVLGHPKYYPRFGFQTANQFGIRAPFPVPEQAFMVLEIQQGALQRSSGLVRYPAYFNEV